MSEEMEKMFRTKGANLTEMHDILEGNSAGRSSWSPPDCCTITLMSAYTLLAQTMPTMSETKTRATRALRHACDGWLPWSLQRCRMVKFKNSLMFEADKAIYYNYSSL